MAAGTPTGRSFHRWRMSGARSVLPSVVRVVGHGHDPSDLVRELPDVAGPVVQKERGDEVVAEPQARPAEVTRVTCEEQRGQRRNLVLAFAERRQAQTARRQFDRTGRAGMRRPAFRG